MDFIKNKALLIRTNSWWDILIHFSMAGVILAIIGVLFMNSFLPSVTHHRETVTVPDLKGMRVDEAERFLRERGLDYMISDSSYSRKHKMFVVLSQDPAPGDKVKQSRRLKLTINPKTPPNVRLPNLRDMQFDDAKRLLESQDIEIGRIKYTPSIAENVILEVSFKDKIIDTTAIRNGFYLQKGSRLDILLGDGVGEVEFSVPNLIGMPYEEAEMVIKANELLLGNVEYDFKSKREIGTVLRQSPPVYMGKPRLGVKAGSSQDDRRRYKVRAGELIDLWVAGNPAAKPKEGEAFEEEEDTVYSNPRERKIREIDQYDKKLKNKLKPTTPKKETPKNKPTTESGN